MIAKFDAYQVGDRLLEDVNFEAVLQENEDGTVTFVEMRGPSDPAQKCYANQLNLKPFLAAAEKSFRESMAGLQAYAERENTTLVALLDEWEASGEERGDYFSGY